MSVLLEKISMKEQVMTRYTISKLARWKESKTRKPLIIQGARQVGKTWIMQEFGRLYYKKTIYINFDNNRQLESIFQDNIDTSNIISSLEVINNEKISPDDTLIIFDEIQEMPNALKSLKYFYEEKSEYHIICAGSLLGIAMHNNISFPVGKVDFLKLYPLSFAEFLEAFGKKKLLDIIKNKNIALLKTFKEDIKHLLKIYYYIGGMPEVVKRFIENQDFNEARMLQKNIILSYELDFSKHAPNNEIERIRDIWNSIPMQLAKENKKFIYGVIKEGARAKEYEKAIMWLFDAGLIYLIYNINTPEIPLKAYVDRRAFKMYALDVGLLGAMANLDKKVLLSDDIFKRFKGVYAEQYVLEQLILEHDSLYYYTNNRNSGEIEFLIEEQGEVIPIEVKAGINLKAKSLKTYIGKYNPAKAFRFSLSDYKATDNLIDIPLYAINYYKGYV